MASTATAPPVLYHLVQKPLWDTHKSQDKPYYPPTYDADGFTHLTKNPDLLLEVANHFYKDVKAPFLCLVCSEDKLTAEVKYEAPAPVGDKKALDESVDKDADVTVFPHLYGAINLDSVIAELKVMRADDGTFTTIEVFGR